MKSEQKINVEKVKLNRYDNKQALVHISVRTPMVFPETKTADITFPNFSLGRTGFPFGLSFLSCMYVGSYVSMY